MMTEIRIDPESTALLLMDLNPPEHGEGEAGLAWRRTLSVIQALVAAARQHGLLVVHLRRAQRTDSTNADEMQHRPDDAVTAAADAADRPALPPPLLGEPVVDTADCLTLQRIHLERILVSGGISALLLAGYLDEVDFSHALGLILEGGYRCLPVGDACLCPQPRPWQTVLHMPMEADDAGTTVVDSAEVLATLRATSAVLT